MNKPLAIGIDDFKKMIEGEYYFVDKSPFIKELLDNKGEVNLFTRPRRFGKTLTLSMLRYFFEKEEYLLSGSVDTQTCKSELLFKGFKIMEAGDKYLNHMGKYPVISLSLKSAKQPDFKMAYASLVDEIGKEYERHDYILQSADITESNKARFRAIINKKADSIDYAKALEFLSRLLHTCHQEKVIILLDEYDVPLENAYFAGFYKEMLDFIRSLFESALKSNLSLEFAVITGCLRISKESIFTGLNNLDMNSILDNRYSEYFGFTKEETEKLLAAYGLEDKREDAGEWYDGYLFGETEVYNPWSIINYVKSISGNPNVFPKPYWANTSSNQIVQKLVEKSNIQVKHEIEILIAGGTIEKPVHEDITYEDIYTTQDNLWNFLFFTGYLKKSGERFYGDTLYLNMSIPNTEVRYIYRNTILEWFDRKVKDTDLGQLYQAVIEGDQEVFGTMVSDQLMETISFYDYAENYYHGFLLGLLKGCPGYVFLSNRESGVGRKSNCVALDVIMKPPSVRGQAIIMELKVVKEFDRMESACEEALRQIDEGDYAAGLYKEGYRKVIKYGICFYRKECFVKVSFDSDHLN